MKEFVKANINLHAILRNLVELCDMDSEMSQLVSDKNISIQFNVKGGPSAHLSFKNGKANFSRESLPSDIKLYFRSPKHLNDMFDNNANPIPTKGFFKINFLKNEFINLTNQLEYYLTPSDALLANAFYFKINAYLTAFTAMHALVEIGNHDDIGQVNASRIPNGIISVEIIDGPTIQIEVNDGVLKIVEELSDQPRASMIFKSLGVASGILNGNLDSFTCIGSGDFEIKGYIPMIDNMNKLLVQVPSYLN